MPRPSLRPLMVLLPVALTACATPAPASPPPAPAPLGIDLGASGPAIATLPAAAPVQAAAAGEPRPPGHDFAHGTMQMAHDGRNDVHATGTVNSVDPAGHKINVTHQPIPQIGWPTMTMDFTVAPAVDLRAVKPGTRIDFSMMQGPDGMYQVQSIAPAGGAGR